MNRRKLIAFLSALPFVGIPAVAQSKKAIVETLEFATAKDTHYKTRWTFDTEEEAIAFVRSLRPELIEVTLKKPNAYDDNVIRSGYRGAIRYISDPHTVIHSMKIKVISLLDKEHKHVDIIDNMFYFDLEFVWLCISNIRVNGKPVHLADGPNKNKLPYLLTQPFIKGNPVIKILDEEYEYRSIIGTVHYNATQL